MQLDISSMRAGPPSSGYMHPGQGQTSPFRLGTISPLDWVPMTGQDRISYSKQSKPLSQEQVSSLRPGAPGPGLGSPLGEAPELCLGHPGVGRGSGSPQWAWQAVRTLFALSRGWSQVVTSPFTASEPSQAAGNT